MTPTPEHGPEPDEAPDTPSPRLREGSPRVEPGVGGPLGALGGTIGPGADPARDQGRGSDGSDGQFDVTAAAAAVLRDRATGWFDDLYRDAAGNPAVVPWAQLESHPYVRGWLDQPGLDVVGVDAVVVGCGLGDDAAELARRGCRVTAFDISPAAVAWARDRFADLTVEEPAPGGITWEVADVLGLPDRLVGAFGLVVEVRTVQSLPGTLRDAAMQGIASLAGPGGWVVATTLLATSDEASRTWEGPPWAQAPAELAAWRVDGLERISLDHPPVDADREAMEVRLVLQRPG